MSDILSLQGMVAEICQRIEQDLKIIGVAAIEDKLQVIPLYIYSFKWACLISFL